MDKKALILHHLREGTPSERCDFLASLTRNEIDGDAFRLMAKIAREESDADLRIAALTALSEFWPDVEVASLLRTLATDPDFLVADASVTCLARAGDPAARQLILEAYLAAPHFAYKYLTFQALTSAFDPSAVMATVTGYYFNDTDEVVRAAAVSFMARRGTQAQVPALIDGLRDPDARVRANCVEALAPYLSIVGVGAITPLLADPHHRVRGATIVALSRVGYRQVDAGLRSLLEGTTDWARATAGYVLRMITDFPGRERILDVLAADPSAAVRRQVALARAA